MVWLFAVAWRALGVFDMMYALLGGGSAARSSEGGVEMTIVGLHVGMQVGLHVLLLF